MSSLFGTSSNDDTSSRNKDTGRVDKYSDETPTKDYADYRKDHPAGKKARKEKRKGDYTYKGPNTYPRALRLLRNHEHIPISRRKQYHVFLQLLS